MSPVRIALVLWGGLFFVLTPLLPPGDGDLWWQRWLGDAILRTHRLPTALGPETFAASGAPWVPQEWLLSLAVAVSMQHGWFMLLRIAFAAIAVLVLLSIVVRARGRAEPTAIALVLIFTGVALVAPFGVRAQVLGWGCFAAFLYFLQRKDGWFYAAAAVALVWANVHASAMLAPAFVAARAIGIGLEGGPRELLRSRELRLLPLAAVAVFLTPLGPQLVHYAGALATSPIRQYIAEWQPVSLTEREFLLGAFPLAIAIALGGAGFAWRNARDSLPVAALFAAALLSRRNEPLFAIAAAPLAAACLDARFPRLSLVGNRTRELERFAIVASCLAFALTGFAYAATNRVAPPTVPVAAIASLAAGGAPKRLFCEDFTDCSLALQYPNVRVFMDGRCDPYPLPIWRQYVATIRVTPQWQQTLQRYGINAVVAPRASALSKAIAAQSRWRVRFRDAAFVLYERG